MEIDESKNLKMVRIIIYVLGAIFISMGAYTFVKHGNGAINSILICSAIGFGLFFTARYASDRVVKVFRKLLTSW